MNFAMRRLLKFLFSIVGYWIWQYDFLGFIRLRKSLKVEVSALFGKQDKFGSQSRDANVLRVMHNDSPPAIDNAYIQVTNGKKAPICSSHFTTPYTIPPMERIA